MALFYLFCIMAIGHGTEEDVLFNLDLRTIRNLQMSLKLPNSNVPTNSETNFTSSHKTEVWRDISDSCFFFL
jgi:hypothetical protein